MMAQGYKVDLAGNIGWFVLELYKYPSPLAQVKNAWTHKHTQGKSIEKREPGHQLRLLSSTKTETQSLNPRSDACMYITCDPQS